MVERRTAHTWHDCDGYPGTTLPDLDQLQLYALHGHLYAAGFLKQGRALCVYWAAGLTPPVRRLTCLRLPEHGPAPCVTMCLGGIVDHGRLWVIGLSRTEAPATAGPLVQVTLQCGTITPPNEAASSVGSVQWSPPVAGPEVGPHTDLRFSATPWRGALVLWTGAALHCYRPDLGRWRVHRCGPDFPSLSYLGCAGDHLFACGRGTWFLCSFLTQPEAANPSAVRCLPVELRGSRPTGPSASIAVLGRSIYVLADQIFEIDSDEWHCRVVPPCKGPSCSQQVIHHKVQSVAICGRSVFVAYSNDPTGERRLAHAALGCPAWAPALLPQCPAAYRATLAAFCRVAVRRRLMPELALTVIHFLPWTFHDGWALSPALL
eukprot:EG_transcript_12706